MTIQPMLKNESALGPVYQSGGANVVLLTGTPFDSEQLKRAFDAAIERDADLHRDLLPERIPEARERTMGALMMSAARSAIDTARLVKSEAMAADARLMEPSRPVDPAIAVEHRQLVRNLDNAAQSRWVEQANLEGLTSVIEGGNRVGLEAPIYERARERFWIENWIARHNAEAEHAASPTVETVVATGPDAAAARAEAEGYLAQHRERMAALEAHEAVAKRLVSFLASLFAITPGQALDRMMGRTDAKAA